MIPTKGYLKNKNIARYSYQCEIIIFYSSINIIA